MTKMKIDRSHENDALKEALWTCSESNRVTAGRTRLPAEVSEAVSALQQFTEFQSELATQQLIGLPALKRIADHVLSLIGAVGAAIALLEGEDLVCKATSGDAPPLGAIVPVDSSLSGECFRTGSVVLSDDTRSDRRFSNEIRDKIPFRSLLIVPISDDNKKTVGLLEVFALEAQQFDPRDVLVLGFVADFIASVLENSPVL